MHPSCSLPRVASEKSPHGLRGRLLLVLPFSFLLEDEMLFSLPALPLQTSEHYPLFHLPHRRYRLERRGAGMDGGLCTVRGGDKWKVGGEHHGSSPPPSQICLSCWHYLLQSAHDQGILARRLWKALWSVLCIKVNAVKQYSPREVFSSFYYSSFNTVIIITKCAGDFCLF